MALHYDTTRYDKIGIKDLPYDNRLSSWTATSSSWLVFVYKILHGLCDVSLAITFAHSSTRGNSFKLAKPDRDLMWCSEIF